MPGGAVSTRTSIDGGALSGGASMPGGAVSTRTSIIGAPPVPPVASLPPSVALVPALPALPPRPAAPDEPPVAPPLSSSPPHAAATKPTTRAYTAHVLRTVPPLLSPPIRQTPAGRWSGPTPTIASAPTLHL
jgi:hypothetical protein